MRNRFQLPPGLSVKNLMPAGQGRVPQTMKDSGLAAYVASLFDQTLSWKDVEWLCSLTRLPVLLKGIVHPDDARLAVEHSAAGVIVSNHGGRQLDTAPATIEALPDIVAAVDEQHRSAHRWRHPARHRRGEGAGPGGAGRGRGSAGAVGAGRRRAARRGKGCWSCCAESLAMGLCGAANVDEIGRDLSAKASTV